MKMLGSCTFQGWKGSPFLTKKTNQMDAIDYFKQLSEQAKMFTYKGLKRKNALHGLGFSVSEVIIFHKEKKANDKLKYNQVMKLIYELTPSPSQMDAAKIKGIEEQLSKLFKTNK